MSSLPFEKPVDPLDLQQLTLETKKATHFFEALKKEKGQKKILDSSHRTATSGETLSRINPRIRKLAGITRIADVTGLDILGIPNYIAVRPSAFFSTPLEGGRVSIFNGKGFTKQQAKASALMEAIERYCGEPFERSPLIATYREMKRRMTTINPNSLLFHQKIDLIFEKAPIEWRVGVDLFTRKPAAVQALNVFAPYVAPRGTAIVNPNFSTTGLASGNSLVEATVHALLEVIERHGTSPCQKAIDRFEIPLESIQSPLIHRLIGKLKRHRVKIRLLYYETGLGFTVCRALIDDPITHDPHLLCYGSGCHLSKEVAIIRAITEAVQSRVTIIAGTREDLLWSEESRTRLGAYETLSKRFWEYYETKDKVSYQDLPHTIHRSFHEDLSLIQKKFEKKGLKQTIIVDLTNPDLKIPVVRVVVPDLPIYDQGHSTNPKDL